MNKAKKILSLLLCAVLLVGASIAGTVAYLTDKAEVKNTFTVGQVHIDLTETDTDRDSNDADNVTVNGVQRDKANAYKLMPGVAVKKDPVVTVKAGSADSYVRVKVTVSVPNWTNENNLFFAANEIQEEFENNPFAQWVRDFGSNYFQHGEKPNLVYGFNSEYWRATTPTISEKTFTYYLYYTINTDNIVKVENENIDLVAPFTYVYPQKDLTNAQMAALAGMTINVEAHAIQADGFNGVEKDAWDVFAPSNS